MGNFKMGLVSVSYTHLDVYKRQVYVFVCLLVHSNTRVGPGKQTKLLHFISTCYLHSDLLFRFTERNKIVDTAQSTSNFSWFRKDISVKYT